MQELLKIELKSEDLAKLGTQVIEKISNAAGILYEPLHLKRVGKAKSKEALREAKSSIQIDELKRQATRRREKEDVIHQRNMESILGKAIPQITEDAQPEKVEDDWITNLFDKCRIISNEDMQLFWSKILAREMNKPGSFSRRTVNALSDLDQMEALMFTDLCGFVCNINGYKRPVVMDPVHLIYTDSELYHSNLQFLDGAGLIHYRAVTHMSTSVNIGDSISYFNNTLVVKNGTKKEGEIKLDVGIVDFTRTGQELHPICNSQPVDGFFEYLQEKWKKYF